MLYVYDDDMKEMMMFMYMYEWYEEDDVYVYVWMMWRRCCISMHGIWLYDDEIGLWDWFMWVFKLGVSICLCAGDATAHNVYWYEWLHMMFYDDLWWFLY